MYEKFTGLNDLDVRIIYAVFKKYRTKSIYSIYLSILYHNNNMYNNNDPYFFNTALYKYYIV